MISVIITAYKEPRTIGRAIGAVLRQISAGDEIIVAAPDDETLSEAKKHGKGARNLKLLKDAGKGKPAALNLAVSKAKGDILVLTDGDVYIGDGAIKPLLNFFRDEKIGAVSGNPASTNPKSDKYGFWAYMLTKVANDVRADAARNHKKISCSGYLFAIRRKLFPKLPEELLSEDGYISEKVYDAGFLAGYSENSKVYVKYPDNFADWIKQKKRSAGGYNQIKKMIGRQARSFGSESAGAFRFFKYISIPLELIWLFELFIARLYLWAAIFKDVNIWKKRREELWLRVESTK